MLASITVIVFLHDSDELENPYSAKYINQIMYMIHTVQYTLTVGYPLFL